MKPLFRKFGKRRLILYTLGVLGALFAVLSPMIFYAAPTANLQMAGRTVALEIVHSQAAQAKGLSGRSSLPTDKGMLFVLNPPSAQCFWMKDMRFSLDIVWLNAARQVVYLQQSISPATYPKNFCPTQPATYVIELDAGQAEKLGIRLGQTLKL